MIDQEKERQEGSKITQEENQMLEGRKKSSSNFVKVMEDNRKGNNKENKYKKKEKKKGKITHKKNKKKVKKMKNKNIQS